MASAFDSWFKLWISRMWVGLPITLAGFWLWHSERKCPKEQRRLWVTILSFVIMLAGVIYTVGFGDWLLFEAIFENATS